jgi:hypothetical protein
MSYLIAPIMPSPSLSLSSKEVSIIIIGLSSIITISSSNVYRH